ncbi:mitochondrial calmodulin-lysine N-methyltransferase [Andalucia godoyi]|uniref:Calmodulin-lysine N-methyltransferase n=1 Tax=Andalucia godoyi TaxID=505711 RepID=A0A8K0F2W0_ANDGO|nr:mitochondrial calmodulin-lysine N-methyltransferase [Andalucia godoyi]|eukprot:ANDGO_01005.mRNA.1 mitochondrial calmodulin-lysine N-methyltransferase
MSERHTSQAARSRWKLLSQFISQKRSIDCSCPSAQSVSVKRLLNFGFLKFTEHASDQNPSYNVRQYSFSDEFSVSLLSRKNTIPTLSEVNSVIGTAFDTTGLITVWPAEEALSYYIFENVADFRGKSVLEIGCGCGLAGLVAAKGGSGFVSLTDANEDVVRLCDESISMNPDVQNCTASVLAWGKLENFATFDFIVSADCLYFEKSHALMHDLLSSALAKNGTALFVCPRRGASLEAFVHLLNGQKVFKVCVLENWNRHIDNCIADTMQKNMDLFDKNLHNLLLITVERLSPQG